LNNTKSPGTIDIVLYNFDVPNSKIQNVSVTVQLTNLKSVPQSATVMRIDDTHANAPAAWKAMGSPMYPTQQQIDQLQKTSVVQSEKIALTSTGSNQAQFTLSLPAYGAAVVSVPL